MTTTTRYNHGDQGTGLRIDAAGGLIVVYLGDDGIVDLSDDLSMPVADFLELAAVIRDAADALDDAGDGAA